jgi:hypothetical protein
VLAGAAEPPIPDKGGLDRALLTRRLTRHPEMRSFASGNVMTHVSKCSSLEGGSLPSTTMLTQEDLMVDIKEVRTELTSLVMDGDPIPIRKATVITQVVTVEGTAPEAGQWEMTYEHDGPDPVAGEHDFVGKGPSGTWTATGAVVGSDSVSLGSGRFRRTRVERP